MVPVVKNLPAISGDIRDANLIPGLGRSPRRGHGNLLQYSCLENPMDWSLEGYGPRDSKELDTTEATYHAQTHAYHEHLNLDQGGRIHLPNLEISLYINI